MVFEKSTADMSGVQRTLTAFFESRTAAQEAVDHLRQHGVDASAISMVEGNDPSASPVAESGGRPYQEEGFWTFLAKIFMPHEDRFTYAEGLRRGGYLVSVETSASDHDAILALLDREGAVDVDQQASEWRSNGWQSPDAGSTAAAASSYGRGMPTHFAATDAGMTRSALGSGIPPGSTTQAGLGSTAGAGLGGSTGTGLGGTSGTGVAGSSHTDATLGGALGDDSDLTGNDDAASPGQPRGRDAPLPGATGGADHFGQSTQSKSAVPVSEGVNVGTRETGHGRARVRSYVAGHPRS